MPGLHILVAMRNDESERVQQSGLVFKNGLEKMKHYPNYISKLLIDANDIMLGFSGYPEYPIQVLNEGNRVIAIEGCIYNFDDEEIKRRLLSLPLGEKKLKNELNEFISAADGEFIVHMYDRQNKIYLVFNDWLGRLPIYYRVSKDFVVVSREVKFIVFLDGATLDQRALADYLLFKFPLGRSTLISDTYRLLPASFLLCDTAQKGVSTESVFSPNLEPESLKQGDIAKITDKLAETFCDALRFRTKCFNTYTPVVSLSGGYDSQAVLAALYGLQAKPVAVTYVNNKSRHELPIAEDISHRLGVMHRAIPVSSPLEARPEEIKQLVYLKDGLNYAAMSYILRFYATVASELGNKIIGYTGEGGDKTMAPMGFNPFVSTVSSMPQLYQSIYFTESIFSWKEVSLLLGIKQAELQERFKQCFSNYPERTFEGKYRHFIIFEKVCKWQSEGEDRNRFFYWFTSPFLAPAFFREALKVSEITKKSREFYRSFLAKVGADIAVVDRYSMYDDKSIKILDYLLNHLPIGATRLLSKQRLYKMQALLNKQNVENVRNIALMTLDDCKPAQEYFNIPVTRKILTSEGSAERLFTLLTLLLYIRLVD